MAAMAFQWSLAALETLMAEDQMDQHAAVLRAFSVVELWRLRRVCRAFHRWGTAALAALPRVMAVGGEDAAKSRALAGVEVVRTRDRWLRRTCSAPRQCRSRRPSCRWGSGI